MKVSGTSINNTYTITHKPSSNIKTLEVIDKSKLKEAPDFSKIFSDAHNSRLADFEHNIMHPESPEEYKSKLEKDAIKQEVQVAFYQGDKLVATLQYDGSTTSVSNGVDFRSLNTSGRSVDAIIDAMKNMLGSGTTAKTYEPGEGPTNAEIHEEMFGSSFQDYVDRAYRSQKEAEEERAKRTAAYAALSVKV